MRKSVSPSRKNPKESHGEGGEESGPSAIKNRVNAIDVSKQYTHLNTAAKHKSSSQTAQRQQERSATAKERVCHT